MRYDKDPIIINLQKSLPDSKTFFKNLENNILADFDKYNDNFKITPQFSKEYYLLREFLVKSITGTNIRTAKFRKKKLLIYKKIRNYKKYIENETKSVEEDIEGIS